MTTILTIIIGAILGNRIVMAFYKKDFHTGYLLLIVMIAYIGRLFYTN